MSRRALLAVLVALPGCGAEQPPLDTGLAIAVSDVAFVVVE